MKGGHVQHSVQRDHQLLLQWYCGELFSKQLPECSIYT